MAAHQKHLAIERRKPVGNGSSIVTGGGHVYPLTDNALVVYRDRFFSADVQKQRVFQAKVDVAKKKKKTADLQKPTENRHFLSSIVTARPRTVALPPSNRPRYTRPCHTLSAWKEPARCAPARLDSRPPVSLSSRAGSRSCPSGPSRSTGTRSTAAARSSSAATPTFASMRTSTTSRGFISRARRRATAPSAALPG